MNISVIVTVMNEGEGLRPLLDSLIHQTRYPDEVVICDGGSTDNTLEVLQEYEQWLPLKIIEAPGANISQGRNRAVAEAAGPIIAGTDAGVVLSPYWLEDLTQPIINDGASVASGWFEPDPYTDFEVVMGATVLPTLKDIDPESFLPSSRSIAYLKSAWEAVGGYPEWLDYCEDLIYDLELREKFGPFPFVETAIAYFRPRGNMRTFYRQYYRYARGDGKANLWQKRHAVRYLTYLLALPLLLRLISKGHRAGMPLLLLGTAVYSRRPVERLWGDVRAWHPLSRLRAFMLIPIIRFVGDVAKMIGYPVGLWWRWKHKDVNRR